MYFDTETGQVIRQDAERESPQGAALIQTYFEDFRDVDGVKMPFTIRQVMPMFELMLKFTEVKHNIEIDDAKFVKPAPAAPTPAPAPAAPKPPAK